MYLKRLDLQGFKSFAQRTTLEFNSGITAIVGPNGSGKSNIADAFRWVLGEQSLKLLRAKEGPDLIFGGGSSRTRTGLAEATLTFDNSAGWLPIDFAEVAVGRRLYRSGESEYFINGSQVRRRDVMELLAKAGVGSNPYTIIGQGLVDLALSLPSEERRRLFEEAAGLSLYKAKRDQALDKLAETMDNLRRAKDILQEISPRLSSLARLAQRAERQKSLAIELESLLLNWYGYQWNSARASLAEAEAKAADQQRELERWRQELQDLRQRAEEGWAREATLRRDISNGEEKNSTFRDGQQEAARQLAVLEERLRLIAEKKLELQKELADLEQTREEDGRRENEARTRLEALQQEEEKARQRLPGVAFTYSRGQDLEEVLTLTREEAFRWATQSATLRNRQVQLQERQRLLEREIAEEENTLASREGERRQALEKASQIAVERIPQEQGLILLRNQREKMQIAQEEVSQRREETQNRLLNAERSLARAEASNALQTLFEESIVSWQREVPGVLGRLHHILQYPPQMVIAVEAALGNLREAVVVESWDTAREILRRRPAMPLTLIPLDNLRPSPLSSAPDAPGVLGLASQFVSCADRFRPLVESLLGTTLVVQDLDIARSISHGRFQTVTLSGELITPQGIIRAGINHREALETLAKAQSEKLSLEETLSQAQGELVSLRGRDTALHLEEEQRQRALTTLDNEHAQNILEAEKISQEISWWESILQQKRAELATLADEERGLAGVLGEATHQEEASLAQLETLQNQLARSAPAEEAAIPLGIIEERIDRAQSLIQELETSRQKVMGQIQEKNSRLYELSHQESVAREEIAVLSKRVGELTSSWRTIQDKITASQEELAELWERRQETEVQETNGRQVLYELEAQHGLLQAEIEKWRERMLALKTQIEMDLESVSVNSPLATQLPLGSLERLESLPLLREIPPETERRMKSLKRTLHQIGGVDTGILGEYQELKERHDFLSEQSSDLEKAEKDLRRMITELNRLIEERFLTTFQAVSHEFETAFVSLFGGGKGRLLLTDPQNMAETGVEIIAQPPGKRRQSLATLSGGERALTGVALVFALLRSGGSPFCLLDEVDATLDETNIRRFREAVQGLAQKTQVVIITHNRATVEAAQTIYGITLEDSTSKVLSLRLEEVPA